MENKKIVRVSFKDFDLVGDAEWPGGVLETYYLINPDVNNPA